MGTCQIVVLNVHVLQYDFDDGNIKKIKKGSMHVGWICNEGMSRLLHLCCQNCMEKKTYITPVASWQYCTYTLSAATTLITTYCH